MKALSLAGAFAPLLLFAATAAQAQPAQPQPIQVSAKDAFKHRHSKIQLPPSLAGLARDRVVEFEGDQIDVAAGYSTPDLAESYTVYVFRHVAGGLPVWFDRARGMIERRAEIGTATLHAARAFAPPGRGNASGLVATYAATGKGYRSAGVALVPLGEWLVKLRVSSKSLSPEELEARIIASLGEIGWPSKMEPAPDAAPVAECRTSLALSGDANPAGQGDEAGASVLMDALLGQLAADPPKSARGPAAPEPRWCRDAGEVAGGGIYRADESTDAYLVALSDSGRALRVGPSVGHALLQAEGKTKPPAYTVEAVLLPRTLISRPFDRLPPPAQAMAIAAEGSFASSVPTWGKEKNRITLGEDALK